MGPEAIEALVQQIDVAAVEAQHAAVVMCWVFGPLAVLGLVVAIASAVGLFREDDGVYVASGIASLVVALLAFLVFAIELEIALAPHAHILTHLINGGG